MFKIGYLGPNGTFAYEAAKTFFDIEKDELIAFPDISGLMFAVDQNKVDMAVVPIENALEGTVNVTADMLVHDVNVKILAEIIIPIKHYLVAKSGTTIENVEMVLSHPQALAQCRKFLYSALKETKQMPTASTAAAAREVSTETAKWAAIANKNTAQIYNLQILAEDIQDHATNSTRFIVLSKTMNKATGDDKTSIAFTVENKPGSLFDALKIFADKNINLTKIESRPMKTLLGQYLFLIDFEGHAEDEMVSAVLHRLSMESKFFIFLGSYPKFKERQGG